ncbi:DUF1622 domain-containing protein [Streptomyces virginiae]|uniref:DUF1622 domain-containing protein n=1 Tax=Streptomyces virginiae TaxID=1961 RepID=UPI0036EEABEC
MPTKTGVAASLDLEAGAVWAFTRFATTGLRRRSLIGEFNKLRLSLGRFLVLGLEFQLAGDVLAHGGRAQLH